MASTRISRKPRGYVLLLVLMLVAVLAVVVTSLYTDTEGRFFSQQQIAAQQIAKNRAEFAAQTALARLRKQNYDGIALTTMVECNIDAVANQLDFAAIQTACPSGVFSTMVDNGTATALNGSTPGGLQYRYFIFARQLDAAVGIRRTNPAVYTVRAWGFYGYSTTSTNLSVAIIDVDIQPNKPSTKGCTGDNHCT